MADPIISHLTAGGFLKKRKILVNNFIGGLAPDIDQPTADLWNRLPAGGVWGRVFYKFLGGHRFISHSLLGVFLFGFLLHLLLNAMSSVVLVDMNVVWWSFMIGFVSHLLMEFWKELELIHFPLFIYSVV
jgi:membrane-bound metal-dependent hydrolase YbcI (DUF457 family)